MNGHLRRTVGKICSMWETDGRPDAYLVLAFSLYRYLRLIFVYSIVGESIFITELESTYANKYIWLW